MMLKKDIIEKEKGKKGIALKFKRLIEGKKKSISLKIDTHDSSSLSSDDEEMKMLVKKFRKAISTKGLSKSMVLRMIVNHILTKIKKKEVICYNCDKPDYITQKVKKKHSKEGKGKKATATIQDTTDDGSSDDSKVKNEVDLCCIALGEKVDGSSVKKDIEVIETEHFNIEELEIDFTKVCI